MQTQRITFAKRYILQQTTTIMRFKKIMLAAALVAAMTVSEPASAKKHWVATWATAEQIAEPHNCPPQPGLAGNSLRQIVETSIKGSKVRLRFSNEFGKEPVEITSAQIAIALTAGESPAVDEGTTRQLSFNGSSSVTIQPGQYVTSDPVKLKLPERSDVAITLHFGSISSTTVTSHPGSRTTSYLATGNTTDFSDAVTTAHWYIINDIEVLAPAKAGSIVALGNSITDGRGTTTNGQDRWTDNLSRRLLADKATRNLSVLNMGLGGNCILNGGLGPTARTRYTRDLFGQAGVKYVILFEGVNDLGGFGDAVAKADQIIEVWKQIASEAHERGIKVIGATVMPFKGNGYYNPNHEAGRKKLNDWILSYEGFDGTIDFAAYTCDPSDPERLNPEYLFENDWLHPNAKGYKAMADLIDLTIFKD